VTGPRWRNFTLRIAGLGALAAVLAACGYVGDPQPPLLNIPEPVRELQAVQRGERILVSFRPPALTTEGVTIRRPLRFELRAGPGPEGAFDAQVWAASAPVYPVERGENGGMHAEIPAASWVGRELILAVKAVGANGRDAGWSPFAVLTVVPPLAAPADLALKNTAAGVEVRWQGAAPRYRVLRQEPDGQEAVLLDTVEGRQYTDATALPGRRYRYWVQAVQPAGAGEAESELSAAGEILAADVTAPAAPNGLRAVGGLGAIELAWEPSPEPDLSRYRLYRSAGEEVWVRIAEPESPSYRDQSIETGTLYRYAVSAVDQAGNEGDRSEPVAIPAP
jgi:hypothetical protein